MIKPLIGSVVMGVVLIFVRKFLDISVNSMLILSLVGVLVYGSSMISMMGVSLIEDAKKVTKQFSLVSLIIIGTITWSLTMVRSGLLYKFGYGFWGPNGHDGIWHIALSNSLSKGTLENPIFSGSLLQNYHLGFDLLLALLNKLTTIPISILYFQILPPIFALMIGLLVYLFVLNWRGSKK